MTLSLRCSALPLAFLCAGSVQSAELRIDERQPQGDLGSAAHECLRALPVAGRIDWDGLPEVARRHNVASLEEELRMLCALAQKAWHERLKESFPEAVDEAPFSFECDEFELTGHIDLYSRMGGKVAILDWKTGRLDLDYREQLLGYCALALLEDDTIEEATAGAFWIRESEWEYYTLKRADLAGYLRRLKASVLDWDGTYRPSASHCKHCRRSHECPARHALVRRDVAAFLGGELTDYAVNVNALERLAPAELLALHASTSLVHSLTENLHRAVRELVERKGDIIDPVSGQRLTIQRTQKRHLKVIPTFPVLTSAGFEDEDFARVTEISVGEVEKIVASRAPYRGGAAAIRKLQAELEAAGCVETTPVSRLITRKS